MAKEHPRYASVEWPEWEFREYPMMVYPLNREDPRKPTYVKSGKRKGQPIAGVVVKDDAELAEVLGLEVEPAAAAPAAGGRKRKLVPGSGGAQRLENDDDELAALQVEATDLGVQFDRSWSLARLQDAIDTKKAEDAEPPV